MRLQIYFVCTLSLAEPMKVGQLLAETCLQVLLSCQDAGRMLAVQPKLLPYA